MLLMPGDFCSSLRLGEGPQLFQDGVETGDPESWGPWYPVPTDPEKGPQSLQDGVRTGDSEGTQFQLILAGPSIKYFLWKYGCPHQTEGRALLRHVT